MLTDTGDVLHEKQDKSSAGYHAPVCKEKYHCIHDLADNLDGPWAMDTSSGDDEAPKDPGAHQAHLQGYTELDFQGRQDLEEENSLADLEFTY
uniref:Uncharacterized protein n=1 Tax=Rhodnius prolixus TaxID=13249 RepID=T1HJ51_RHOPR